MEVSWELKFKLLEVRRMEFYFANGSNAFELRFKYCLKIRKIEIIFTL